MSDQIDKGDSVSCVLRNPLPPILHISPPPSLKTTCVGLMRVCRWNWGGGAPSGTVKDVKEEETTIKSKNNKDVRLARA